MYSGLNYRREVYPWAFAKNNEEFQRTVKNLRAIGGTTNTRFKSFLQSFYAAIRPLLMASIILSWNLLHFFLTFHFFLFVNYVFSEKLWN